MKVPSELILTLIVFQKNSAWLPNHVYFIKNRVLKGNEINGKQTSVLDPVPVFFVIIAEDLETRRSGSKFIVEL
jgi:hypothetical protein